MAGVAYPSDVAAGMQLGRAVADLVIARAKTDGSDLPWTGSVPVGQGKWTGTNPIEPTAGSWRTWALTSGSQFRPGPRAAYDSEQLRRELDEGKNFQRTNLTNLTANYWEYYGGPGNSELWNSHAARLIFEYRLDGDPPHAARIYALVYIAHHDASVACWDAKYTYWEARPAMLDPTITTLFATPNHPSYPSAHSCVSGAAAAVLGQLFPREAAYFQGVADEAGMARIAAGIHVRSDVEAGKAIAMAVARTVVERGR